MPNWIQARAPHVSYAILMEAGALLASSLDYETTVQRVASLTVPEFADWAAIDLLDSDGTLRRVAVKHTDPSKHEEAHELARRYPARLDDSGGVGYCTRTGETRWSREIPDASLAVVAHDADHLAIMRSLGLRSVIVVPLVAHGRRVGAMSFVSAVSGRLYEVEDVAFAEELARRVASAIANARLFAAEQEARDRLARLQRLTSALSAALLPAQVGQVVVHETRATLGADTCTVYLANDDDGLTLLAHEGVAEGYLDGLVDLPLTDGLPSTTAFRHGTPVAVENKHDYQRMFPALANRPATGPRAEAFLCVPLALENKTLGVLGLGFYKPRTLGPQERDLTMALARQCAQALERSRLTAEAVGLREQFLAIASHELNTPITALLLMVQTLKKHPADPARVATNAARAEKQVQRLAKLVHQLLDVSRITGGRLALEAETFDLSALVVEGVERARDDAQGEPNQIQMTIAPALHVHLDRGHVEQVVVNLVSNALKYGRKQPIEISLAESGGRARLVVKDHGLGIAPEHQARIFQRFERAVSSRHYGGFGLGLWIVRQIVEACAGEILVDSAPEQGSTFTVLLPLTPRGAK